MIHPFFYYSACVEIIPALIKAKQLPDKHILTFIKLMAKTERDMAKLMNND